MSLVSCSISAEQISVLTTSVMKAFIVLDFPLIIYKLITNSYEHLVEFFFREKLRESRRRLSLACIQG